LRYGFWIFGRTGRVAQEPRQKRSCRMRKQRTKAKNTVGAAFSRDFLNKYEIWIPIFMGMTGSIIWGARPLAERDGSVVPVVPAEAGTQKSHWAEG